MPINENFNENQLNLISTGLETINSFDVNSGDYIRLSIFSKSGVFTGRQFYSNRDISGTSDPQIKIYINDVTNDIFVKPNDIMNLNGVPTGDYLLQFDFLRNVFSGGFNDDNDARFYISEISPSRKEVRLYARSHTNTNLPFSLAFLLPAPLPPVK